MQAEAGANSRALTITLKYQDEEAFIEMLASQPPHEGN